MPKLECKLIKSRNISHIKTKGYLLLLSSLIFRFFPGAPSPLISSKSSIIANRSRKIKILFF